MLLRSNFHKILWRSVSQVRLGKNEIPIFIKGKFQEVKSSLLDGQMNQSMSGFKDGHVWPVQDPHFRVRQFSRDVAAGIDVSFYRVHVAFDDAHTSGQPVPVGLTKPSSQLTQATLVIKVVTCKDVTVNITTTLPPWSWIRGPILQRICFRYNGPARLLTNAKVIQ